MTNDFPIDEPRIGIGKNLDANLVISQNRFFWKGKDGQLEKITSGIIQLRIKLNKKNKCKGNK